MYVMRGKSFYAIGHLVEDLQPRPHIAGAVSYSAMVAKRLGYSAHIVTKCSPNHLYINKLSNTGLHIHLLPIRSAKSNEEIISFKNDFDESGRRKQVVAGQQEPISLEDLKNFPKIPRDAIVLVAPVINEVEASLLPMFSNNFNLAVTPQGYFRKVLPNGAVKQTPWKYLDVLKHSEAVILSDEDIDFDQKGGINKYYLKKLTNKSKSLILTRGSLGSIVYENRGKGTYNIKPFQLESREEINLSGSGDVYAASYLICVQQGASMKDAAVFASFYTALKIADIEQGQYGLATVPTIDKINGFVRENKERVESFFKT